MKGRHVSPSMVPFLLLSGTAIARDGSPSPITLSSI
jgi:hypothetical protein